MGFFSVYTAARTRKALVHCSIDTNSLSDEFDRDIVGLPPDFFHVTEMSSS